MAESGNRLDLRKKILKEMTVDYVQVLEENFNLAKQFFRLTKTGEVELLVKDEVTGKEKILLYLTGKIYSKEAGLSTTDEVGNQEFMDKLGFPSGSLLPWLKSLRDDNRIKQTKRERNSYHSIAINEVEPFLKELAQKVNPKSE